MRKLLTSYGIIYYIYSGIYPTAGVHCSQSKAYRMTLAVSGFVTEVITMFRVSNLHFNSIAMYR